MVGQTNNYVTYIDKIKNPAETNRTFCDRKIKKKIKG